MRGSKPGERRGGRLKGTPNRRTLEVQQRLAELGCDPVEGMARLALDESNTPELRGKMFSELAGYVVPKRRAIEHTGADGGPIRVDERRVVLDVASLDADQREQLRALLIAASPK